MRQSILSDNESPLIACEHVSCTYGNSPVLHDVYLNINRRDFVGIVGGWIVAHFQLQVASGLYWSSITEGLYIQDLWMGLIKPFALGFVIVSIACHVGLRTSGGTQGVGRATTNAVVAGSVAVIAADFFITRILFALLY